METGVRRYQKESERVRRKQKKVERRLRGQMAKGGKLGQNETAG